MGKDLYVYFLQDPNATATLLRPPLELEARIVPEAISIDGVAGFMRILGEKVTECGGKVKRMVISGHGAEDGFRIGRDRITLDSIWWPTLFNLRLDIAPDAQVDISACETGQNRELLKKLSLYWGGVKVRAWTGTITPWEWGPLNGINNGGDEVVRGVSSCSTHRLNIDKLKYITTTRMWGL
jgi:hypothetical protein